MTVLATTCPVAVLAAEVRALHEAAARNDERMALIRPGPEWSRLSRVDESIAAGLEALELVAAEHRASSVEGALFQLGVVLGEVDVLHLHAAPRLERDAQAIYWRVYALLDSVAAMLEGLGGVLREAVFGEGEHYIERGRSPVALVDEALASREAVRAQA